MPSWAGLLLLLPRAAKPLVSPQIARQASPKSRDLVTAVCAALPGTGITDPWGGGHACWKVGGKMLAGLGGHGDGVDVKHPDVETARLLIDFGGAARAPHLQAAMCELPPTASSGLCLIFPLGITAFTGSFSAFGGDDHRPFQMCDSNSNLRNV